MSVPGSFYPWRPLIEGFRWQVVVLGMVVPILAGCGRTPSGHSTSSTSNTLTASQPTLGMTNAGCHGCGEVAPSIVIAKGYTVNAYSFPGIVFTKVHWQKWGSSRATALGADAFYIGAGESSTVTLYAFDLGTCGTTYGYRAMEWVATHPTLDSTSYYNTCTGRGVGAGFPG